MTAEDLAKLPRWARARIMRLEGDVEHWKSKALAAAAAPGKGGATDTYVIDYADDLRELGLPPHAHLRFRLPKTKRTHDGTIDVHTTLDTHQSPPGVLAVRALDGLLVVQPAAANLVYVWVEPR